MMIMMKFMMTIMSSIIVVILKMIPAFSGVRIICGDHSHANGHDDPEYHDDGEDFNQKSVLK